MWPSPWDGVGKRWGQGTGPEAGPGKGFLLPGREAGAQGSWPSLKRSFPSPRRSLEVVEASTVPEAWSKGLET